MVQNLDVKDRYIVKGCAHSPTMEIRYIAKSGTSHIENQVLQNTARQISSNKTPISTAMNLRGTGFSAKLVTKAKENIFRVVLAMAHRTTNLSSPKPPYLFDHDQFLKKLLDRRWKNN